MALNSAPDINICLYLGFGENSDSEGGGEVVTLLLESTMLSQIISELERLMSHVCKLERLSVNK